MHSPIWWNTFSFSNRIMLFIRLSLIHGENQTTHTRIGLLISKTCMPVATAKLPGLIITSLILPHPILTAIACHLHIIMNGHTHCSLYATALMLLYVIVSLWSHLSIPMMGRRGQEHSIVLNTLLRNHTTFMMK
jgi:hypothetical protein